MAGLIQLFALTSIPEFLKYNADIIAGLIVILLLLAFSAGISGSEVAFFSLNPTDIAKIQKEKTENARALLTIIGKPEELLTTILILNNLMNIGIVVLGSYITGRLFDFSASPVAGFIIEVVVITLIILLFGEILPKIYATRNNYRFALLMARPFSLLCRIFKPLSEIFILSTRFVRKRKFRSARLRGMKDISDALEFTRADLKDEGRILKSIVKFSDISASAIMCPRIDVIAVNIRSGFRNIIQTITDSGFSRIPVYSGTFDNITGILYAKDVLPYSEYPDSFKWQSLIRPPYFVPETKKIDELLKEFQSKKIHMAIVIDEYGGTSGIISLEDILEEIVGEITDETDEDKPLYRIIDRNTYIFEGKILLNDFYKILNIEEDLFVDIRGESETLAGLLLELTGEIPVKGDKIHHGNFDFIIESSDKKRIKEVKVIIRSDAEKTDN